jgi:Fe-S oxidoreductase
MYTLAAQTPGLANMIAGSWPGKWYLKWKYGISPLRDLPKFAKEPFHRWNKRRKKETKPLKVLLYVDLFTNYHEPEVAKAAIKVLERMGFEVIVPSVQELGRTYLSKGVLDRAREIAETVVKGLYPFAAKNYPLIGLEPSEILTIRDEFLDLVDDSLLEKAEVLASKTYTFEEFVSRFKRKIPEPATSDRKVVLHGHCHTKALTGNQPTILALEAAGFEVEELDTGCCGMAGSFGYEAEHYQLSMDIGWQRLFPQLGNLEENCNICAPGFSCRHQIKDGTGMNALHPAQLIASNLNL